MATAHCSTCDAEVESIDGVCLLGHPAGERSRLDDLRAEVDRAFEAASREVAAVLTGEIPVVPKAEPVRQATEPLRLDTPVLSETRVQTPVPQRPAEQIAPTTWQAQPAPPPPPGGRLDVAGMWEKANQPGNDDPINAFAPAPRLDWGPEAKKGLRRRIES